jgi:hypothetical protein
MFRPYHRRIPEFSNKGDLMIVEIDRVAPGELDKEGASFWKALAYSRYSEVAISCERCGAIRMFSFRLSSYMPRLCRKCAGIALSAKRQGISLEEWNKYATEQKYCSKFNESLKRAIREKYNNKCFLCGKPQSDNITTVGKQKALSVHHVDMNKDQGCNDHDWYLVPLCMEHHGRAHSKMWQARIEYLLDKVWE